MRRLGRDNSALHIEQHSELQRNRQQNLQDPFPGRISSSDPTQQPLTCLMYGWITNHISQRKRTATRPRKTSADTLPPWLSLHGNIRNTICLRWPLPQNMSKDLGAAFSGDKRANSHSQHRLHRSLHHAPIPIPILTTRRSHFTDCAAPRPEKQHPIPSHPISSHLTDGPPNQVPTHRPSRTQSQSTGRTPPPPACPPANPPANPPVYPFTYSAYPSPPTSYPQVPQHKPNARTCSDISAS
ncbi:hypothetical protein P171DRAFT_74487 [Karstenula rhodostoma CBS 690.94]|uniref:Uncharacterized protein n=1 Tax=Karstenula rhodostoma CBS 690.94 TaxID=1392251 RepID=A0A9P4PCR2_9PLEO|nr:hypothetical protein P171DRAFT_74487 [Karstenula rhodostoma CBS 690.94]